MADVLVLLETDGTRLGAASLPAVRFAQLLAEQWQTDFDLLALGGADIEGELANWTAYGARRIWRGIHAAIERPTADRIASVGRHVMERSGARSVIAASTTFGRDVLPRLAEMVDLPMVSDVVGIDADPAGLRYTRNMFAGNVIATVELLDRAAAFSVRPSAFGRPESRDSKSEIELVQLDDELTRSGATWISSETASRSRPELTGARVVVSGGRPLKDAATFEKLVGGLADALHGAAGATRAAVDSGIASNDLQVGQTGKVVAPDLYIAAGVSGSVQHLAGMKDSRVIVAINTDPEAPIFAVADYGLVADLHQALPALIEAVTTEAKS